MGKLEGQVAVITGGARGQGRSHAVAIAREGADVVVCDVCHDLDEVRYPMAREEDLEETVRLIEKEGRRGIGMKADVRDYDQVKAALAALPGVGATHDLHIWSMSTTETVLTAHLVMAREPGETLLADAATMLHERFAIGHTTLQIERDAGCETDC